MLKEKVSFLKTTNRQVGDCWVVTSSEAYNKENTKIFLEINDFKDKDGEVILFFDSELKQYFLIVGGKVPTNEKEGLELGLKIWGAIDTIKITRLVLDHQVVEKLEDPGKILVGIMIRHWCFDKYKTKNECRHMSCEIVVLSQKKTDWTEHKALLGGIELARNLISEPGNVIYPESFVKQIEEILKPIGVKIEILDQKKMQELGMNALLGVAQGSAKKPYTLIMKWEGGQGSPIVLAGKGVTFDTGGISLKPADRMHEMKYDMGGAGVVGGIMCFAGLAKLPVNLIGIVGLVENMPDGDAQRPGDVVKSMSGQTIEVLNTDAEGRLVLADILWYAKENFKPKLIIDFATLTGAIVVALGKHYAGLFSNNDQLAADLTLAGQITGEKVWRLPMGPEYDKQIDSKVADMQNISNTSGGGSITAAQFLERFVDDVPWAHLDIAGVTWNSSSALNEGATGFGVRLIAEFLKGKVN